MCDYYIETLYSLLLTMMPLATVNINIIIDYLPVMISKTITYSNENQECDGYDEFVCFCRDSCDCTNRKLVRHSVFILRYPIRWEYSDENVIDLLNSVSDYTLLYCYNKKTFKTIMEITKIVNEKETDPEDHDNSDSNCYVGILSEELWSPRF
jgi:hypothetical protein